MSKKRKQRKRRGPFRLLNHLLATGDRSTERWRLFDAATAFSIQNVAEHYLVGCDKEDWDEQKDFPYLAPPMPIMWMEYRVTPEIHSDGNIIKVAYEDQGHYGFIISTLDVERDAAVLHAKDGHLGGLLEPAFREGCRWVSLVSCYASAYEGHRRITVPTPVKFSYAIHEDGSLMGNTVGDRFVGRVTMPPGRIIDLPEDKKELLLNGMLRTTITSYHPCLLALSLIHCKNVEVEDVDDPDAPPPVAPGRKPTRRQRTPRTTYRVLKITPVGKKAKGRSTTESGRHTALHVCRGHFKRFGEEHGRGKLYGKHNGMYWWNMHARGNAGDGVVLKDYDVKA